MVDKREMFLSPTSWYKNYFLLKNISFKFFFFHEPLRQNSKKLIIGQLVKAFTFHAAHSRLKPRTAHDPHELLGTFKQIQEESPSTVMCEQKRKEGGRQQ